MSLWGGAIYAPLDLIRGNMTSLVPRMILAKLINAFWRVVYEKKIFFAFCYIHCVLM